MRSYLTLAALVSLVSGIARADTFLISNEAGSLYRVDVTSGAATLIGHTGKQLTDIAFSPAGELYGLSDPDDIYRIDLSSIDGKQRIATQLLGSLGLYNGGVFNRREVTSLEFGPDGLLYFATNDGLRFSGGVFVAPTGWLGAAQISPFSAQLIGDIGFNNGGDLAFDDESTLYMNACAVTGLFLECSDTRDNSLVRLDPPLGTGTDLGNIDRPNVFGMDFVDGTLYGVTNESELLRIHPGTGLGTLVATITPAVRATGATSIATFPPGDFDGSGLVDEADYERWRSSFGMTVIRPGAGADGNGNGVVDAADYVVWRNRLSASAAANGSWIGIPEPPTAVFLASAFFFFIPLRTARRGFFTPDSLQPYGAAWP